MAASRSLRLLLAVVVLAVLASACSRDPADYAEFGEDAGYVGPGAPTTVANGTANAAASGAPTTATSGDAGVDQGGFGDLGTVCSEGEGTPEPLSGETGLDGTTIHLGTLADPGFAGRPGLNQEMHDIAEAVVAWCNSHGGVRGYELAVDTLDSKLTEHQARILEACDRDWFLVGGGSVFDDAGQPARLACGLPDVPAFVVTPAAIAADLAVQPVPLSNTTQQVGIHAWLAKRFPEAVKKVGTLTGAIETTKVISQRHIEAAEDLGWKFVAPPVEYNPLGEQNWKPFVQQLIDKGARGLLYSGEPENLVKIEQAMSDLGYEPDFVFADANVYDPEKFIKVGGDAIAPTFTYSYFWPFEKAADNPTGATQDYLDILADNGGGKAALLGAQGMSAWMLFLASLGTCVDDGTVTRDCVFDTARTTDSWTGGGLHAPIDVAARRAPECFLALEATPDGFTTPDVDANQGIYNCSPDNVYTLTGDYGSGARCGSGTKDPLPSECG